MKRLHKSIISRGAGNPGIVASRGPAAWFRYNTGITVTGAGVSQWDDQSGNGRHLKQGTDGNRPALQADGSILFDGVDNYLKCDAFTLNQPETVYILFKQVSWTNQDYIFDGNSGSSMVFRQDGSTPQVDIIAGSGITNNSDLAVGAYGVSSCVFNGASSLLQINLGTPTTGNCGANNAGGFTLGANATGGANFANIQVKEVIIFPAANDATQRARVIRYLMGIGGVA